MKHQRWAKFYFYKSPILSKIKTFGEKNSKPVKSIGPLRLRLDTQKVELNPYKAPLCNGLEKVT